MEPGPAWQRDRVGSGDPNLAELGAIYLALLFHPAERPLTLCTDSLFALQQLRWLTDQLAGLEEQKQSLERLRRQREDLLVLLSKISFFG